MTLEIQAPSVSAEKLTRNAPNRTPVDRGPNLFLDNGWLAQSRDTGNTLEVTVAGQFEEYEMRKGEHKGELAEKVTGDAAEVTRQLREAAQALGIGVSIKYFPVVNRGKEVKGKLTVRYLATKRKTRRTTPATNNAATTDTKDNTES